MLRSEDVIQNAGKTTSPYGKNFGSGNNLTDSIPIQKVSDPIVAIGLDKMNVFYIGVENPVTIAASGIKPENLFVKISLGSITGSKGKYVVTVTSVGETMIEVYGIVNGKEIFLSKYAFRVKRIPDPVNGIFPMDFDAKANIK